MRKTIVGQIQAKYDQQFNDILRPEVVRTLNSVEAGKPQDSSASNNINWLNGSHKAPLIILC